jgi:hypothetical protein
MRLLDPYSGPASSLWSLRSLVMAYYYPPHHDFWTAPPRPLPVEHEDFSISLPGPRWRVTGCSATGEIRVEIPANEGRPAAHFEPAGRVERLRCALGLKPRPANLEPKYDAPSYSSESLFFVK